MLLVIMLLGNVSRATWNPAMTCSYSIAYSVTTSTRDNRGIALTSDGQYLYLGYNNGPDFRKIQISNGSYLAGNTTDRAKSIAIDDMGRVYTTGPDGTPIKIYSSSLGTIQHTITMDKCEGIAVRRESGNLYLYATERNLGTLCRFLLTESGGSITAHALNGLDGDGVVSITGGNGIRGVAVGADGKILIANPGTGKISKLNANGSGQVDYTYASNDNPYYFSIIDDQVFVTHGNYNSGTRVAVITYSTMTLVGNIIPPFAALGLKTTDAADMISGIAAFPDNKGFYITYEDGSAANDSYKEPVIKVVFPPVHNITKDTYYSTLQSAIDAASNNNVIEADGGTYVIPAGTQLTINKQITLQPKAGLSAKPIITTSYSSWSACAVQIAANNVILDGFEITSSWPITQNPNDLVGDYGAAKNNWTVKNCNIHQGYRGIMVNGNNITIQGNEIHETYSDCIDCEYGKGGGLTITHNWLHAEHTDLVPNAKPAGITYNCDATAEGAVEISYNYCNSCRTFIDFQHNGGTAPSNNIVIKHNTVDWNLTTLPASPIPSTTVAQQMSIAFWTGSGSWTASKFTIRDNIFSRQKWYAIVNTSSSTGPIVGSLNLNNNLFYQWYLVDTYYPGNASPNEWPATRGAVGWNNYDGVPTFTNDIQAEPKFAASGTSYSTYYALAPGSPAHHAASDGTDIGAWQTQSITWTGTVSTDWNTSGNWSTNTVPQNIDDAVIPNVSNKPIVNQAVSSPAVCNGLTIQSGSSVTVNPDKAMTVFGTLANNSGASGLVVKSGGSLIETSIDVPGTVERVITSGSWHFISSPVTNAVSGMFTGYFLQKHTESTNLFTDILPTNVPLTPVQGFSLWGDAGLSTTVYAGTLNAGTETFSTTYSGSGKGWNLVGNPYPSSIDWNAASGWTKTGLNNATYVYQNNSVWATYVNGVGTNGGTRYIAPSQGFFVLATGAGTLAMTDAVRVHNATQFFKNSDDVVNNLVRLQVSGNNYTDEAVIRFLAESTSEFDGDYDAGKLYGGIAEAPQIYSLGSTLLAINTLPETNVVPVGIHVGTNGNYTISATEIKDFSAISLEDTKTGTFTDLLKASYTFNFIPGENEQRFLLHFGPLAIKNNENGNIPEHAYSYQQTVYVDMKDQNSGNIFIYSISGRLVVSLPAKEGINKINLTNMGFYIVKLITDKSTSATKVWID